MNAKQIVTLVVGIAALIVSVWKGPSVWGALSAGITSVCLLALPLLSAVPALARLEEYVADLEAALEAEKPGAVAELKAVERARTWAQANVRAAKRSVP